MPTTQVTPQSELVEVVTDGEHVFTLTPPLPFAFQIVRVLLALFAIAMWVYWTCGVAFLITNPDTPLAAWILVLAF